MCNLENSYTVLCAQVYNKLQDLIPVHGIRIFLSLLFCAQVLQRAFQQEERKQNSMVSK